MTKAAQKRILIVDDESAISEVLAQVMQVHGFKVEAAKNWPEVLARVAARRPDLVVLDLMIPGAAPQEMVRHFQSPELAKVPLIIISGRYGDDKLVDGMRAEPNVKDFFKKPFGYVELANRIHEVLGTKSPPKPKGTTPKPKGK
ncbi:MAG: response regulator [Elusimicrobia bacterium]|nr:response regulator [Elusimicrobiota bacterium]